MLVLIIVHSFVLYLISPLSVICAPLLYSKWEISGCSCPNMSPSCLVSITPSGPRSPHCWMELHWLPGAAIIKFKSLNLTYRRPAGSAPSYLNNLVGGHVGGLLCSTHERHQAKPPTKALNGGTMSWPVSEQERPPDLCQTSLLRTPNSISQFPPISTLLLSPSLLFITLFTPSNS